MVSTVVKQKGAPSSKGAMRAKLCMDEGVVSTSMRRCHSGCSSARRRTKDSVSGRRRLTMMTISSASLAEKMRTRRSIMAVPQSGMRGLGAEMPSSARREPSPAAMMANFMRKGK